MSLRSQAMVKLRLVQLVSAESPVTHMDNASVDTVPPRSLACRRRRRAWNHVLDLVVDGTFPTPQGLLKVSPRMTLINPEWLTTSPWYISRWRAGKSPYLIGKPARETTDV